MMTNQTETDLILLAYSLSLWADPFELEAALEEAFDQSGLDLGTSDVCSPYGSQFGFLDMSTTVQR